MARATSPRGPMTGPANHQLAPPAGAGGSRHLVEEVVTDAYHMVSDRCRKRPVRGSAGGGGHWRAAKALSLTSHIGGLSADGSGTNALVASSGACSSPTKEA